MYISFVVLFFLSVYLDDKAKSDSLIMKNYSILIHPKREDGGGDYKVIIRRYIVKSYDLKGASVQAETIVKPGETFSCQEQNPKQIEY